MVWSDVNCGGAMDVVPSIKLQFASSDCSQEWPKEVEINS